MYLICEETIKETVSFLARLSRGRVPCKDVQKGAFEVLQTLRARHPELLRKEVITLEEKKPCKQE